MLKVNEETKKLKEEKETRRKFERERDLERVKDEKNLDCYGCWVPDLSHQTVKLILLINKGILKVLLEFQNRGWTSDPDCLIYQKRLQTNLVYLATVADYYLNPQKLENPNFASNLDLNQLPNLPNPFSLDTSPLPNDKISSGRQVNELLFKLNQTFRQINDWVDPRLYLYDSQADIRVAMSMNALPKINLVGPTFSKLPAPSPYDVTHKFKVEAPNTSDLQPNNYTPTPPFRLPPNIKIPELD